MDLTRDFIEKIEEMAGPKSIEAGSVEYTRENLFPVLPPKPVSLRTKSLTSIVDYLRSNIDGEPTAYTLIHVYGPETVTVNGSLECCTRTREEFLEATAPIPHILFNEYMDRDAFNVMLQSCFKGQGDRDAVLKVVGNICLDQNSGVEVSDDGVTQNVEAKTGAVLKTKATIPNPVRLAPFRTFTEVEQPESAFVLRINQNMQVALFEADGGAWRQEAMKNIQAYLIEALSDEDGNCPYTIIA